MRNKIEELDLMYGITINNIFSNYEEFKHCNFEVVGSKLNDYLCWLENQNNISSFNVVKISESLLEDTQIRNAILNKDIEELHSLTTNLLKNFNFEKINQDILQDSDSFNIKINPFSKDFRNILGSLDSLKKYLYSSKLIYKDLILMFINNFTFKKRLNHLHEVDWTLDFLNVINEMFYQLDLLLCSNRDDLYYSFTWLMSYGYANQIMFPTYYPKNYNKEVRRNDIRTYIVSSMLRSLHSIHKHYYISVKKYNYNNYDKYNSCKYFSQYDFIKFIFSKLYTSEKIFLIKTSIETNYKYSNNELKDLENLVNNLKTCKDINITTQKPDEKMTNLIEASKKFVEKYCKENNIIIKEINYNPSPEIKSSVSQIFLELYIEHNNFDYKFSIRKFNNNLRWVVKLKEDKEYQINLYLEDDFKHIIQAMIND